VIHWTVCVVHIIILKVIFGVGKLSSALASASKFCPRPCPRPRRFVLGLGLGLGLGDLSSASASRICPRLTSLPETGNRYCYQKLAQKIDESSSQFLARTKSSQSRHQIGQSRCMVHVTCRTISVME